MANVNNSNPFNNNSNNSSNQSCSRDDVKIYLLRDLGKILQSPPMKVTTLPAGKCQYDFLIDMMNDMSLSEDGIQFNNRVRDIIRTFCQVVHDELTLRECMEYMNDKALEDDQSTIKFAMLFASREFDALAMNDVKIRSVMLQLMEKNFASAEKYRTQNINRLYNSIAMLGEYYSLVRLADSCPIAILGESLLTLLTHEINSLEPINAKLAKLILRQVTINGILLRVTHKAELSGLLFHVRRNLIEQPSLKEGAKAYMLMTLDVYHNDFTNIDMDLANLYAKYLNEVDYENNNYDQAEEQTQNNKSFSHGSRRSNSFHNTPNKEISPNSSFKSSTTKTWSQQVCEESLMENEYAYNNNGDGEVQLSPASDSRESEQRFKNHAHDDVNENPKPGENRRYDKRSSGNTRQNNNSEERHNFVGDDETRNGLKHTPRWRSPRFLSNNPNNRDNRRRFSASYEDDLGSVHSETTSGRLFTIPDRLKHSEEQKARNKSVNSYNYVVENWDRQWGGDDRSERSYASNNEYGNGKHGRGRHYNNRQTYDKPPRFQRHQQQQQQQQHHQQPQQKQQQHPNQRNQPNHHHFHQQQQQPYNQRNDNKIRSDSWRRTNYNRKFDSANEDDRRSTTLPRSGRGKYDDRMNSNNFRRSQSPTHSHHNQRRNSNPKQRTNSGRYDSQNSLASEDVKTPGERRFNPRNNNSRNHYNPFKDRSQTPQTRRKLSINEPEREEVNWDDDDVVATDKPESSAAECNWDDDDELVRKARQTTKYMHYLSSK